MDNLTDASAILTLKEITHCCSAIRKLLAEDQIQFERNNLVLLDESNHQKVEQLEKLNQLMEKISRHYMLPPQTNLMTRIENNLTSLSIDQRTELRSTINEFRSELEKCNATVIKNIDIVFAGLKQLNNIWDKLLASKPKIEDTYENIGKKS